MENKVTVVIPARNEEKNIKKVIDIVKQSPYAGEILVVNNHSEDNTIKIAKESGARVVNCDEIGKGYAMAKGVKAAQYDIIAFLDADVSNYQIDIIEKMVVPIFNNEAEFVKSTFDRTAGGTVTQIAVKPLLKIMYPDLYEFKEPLSGMIAGKKEILEKLELEHDYGVDIGIVIDLYNMKVNMKEVNIGEVINMSHEAKTKESMQKMAYQVMRTIVKKSEKLK